MDNNTQTNNIAVDDQDLDNQIENLSEELGKIEKEIDENNDKVESEMNDIEKSVDGSIVKIESIHAELDQAEKEAGDDLDKLVLEQIDDLTRDDSDEE